MRKWIKAVIGVCVVLLALVASESVLAYKRHHSHVRFSFVFGAPLAWHYYWHYPAPVYYSYPAVAPAPVYVERAAPQAEPESRHYWYYCADARAYYPYVRQCPGGWERVAPRPRD